MSEFTTLIDRFLENHKKNPDMLIYRFLEPKGDGWTYEDYTMDYVYRKGLATANMLRKKGLKAGDRAVIFSMQDIGTICSVIGCMMAGVVFTIIPPPIDEGKIERFITVVKSCEPKAIMSNDALEKENGGSGEIVKRLLKEAPKQALRIKKIYSDHLSPYLREDVIVKGKENTLVYLQYTSGSTNAPKGVRVTWKALMANVDQCLQQYDFNNVTLGTWVPFFHNLGLVITIMIGLVVENSVGYYLNTMKFLENPKLWIKMMYDFKLQLTLGPGSAYDACTRIFAPEDAAKYPLTHVKYFMNGSEFVSPSTCDKFAEMFALAPNAMAPGYGLAECVCLATFCNEEYKSLKLDYDAYRAGKAVITDSENCKEIVSVGKPVPGVNIVVGNPKTKKMYGDLKIGEIFVNAPNLADGYWGDIKDNRNFHFKFEGHDKQYYRTGDLGFMYEGQLYITGRIKEMIIVNGHNIFPGDIMLLLQQKIPKMSSVSAAFFSVHTDEKEQVVAVVEGNPAEEFDKRVHQINSAVSERFGFSFHDIIFVPMGSLPRTDNRKLQTVKIKALYTEGKLTPLYSSHEFQHSAGNVNIIDKSLVMADDVMIQIKDIFEKVLHIEQYSITDSFLELGGDSLMGFELMNKVEEKFHIKLDLREILTDSSVAGITQYIHNILDGKKGGLKKINISSECKLDEDIRVEGEYDKLNKDCSKVLLTGATGFLGAQLIRAMMDQYPKEGLEIYCLVRADSEESGMNRIVKNMKHYQCWKDEYEQYIHPVLGDFALPTLGMSDALYEELSEKIEIVYHNGAMLNFVYPYEFLRHTNVGGTVNTIRFACHNRPKYYQYVSSYSVYDTPNHIGKTVYEDDPMEVSKGFSLAYSETKWVSEKIVHIAETRGLKAAIYRPGDITGAENGIWEMEDMVSRMIVGMTQMLSVPRNTYKFHMTPVDYVADALVFISRKRESSAHTFNLVNPNPVKMTEIVDYLRHAGYKIRYVPFPIWKSRFKNMDASQNALSLLGTLFEKGTENNPGVLRHFIGKTTVYSTKNTDLLLSGSGVSCPKITEKTIRAYLKYFKKKGYL